MKFGHGVFLHVCVCVYIYIYIYIYICISNSLILCDLYYLSLPVSFSITSELAD